MGHVEREAPGYFTVVLHRDRVARINQRLNLANGITLRPHVFFDFLDRPVEFLPPTIGSHLAVNLVELTVSSDLAPEILETLAERREFVPARLLHEARYPRVERHDSGLLRHAGEKIERFELIVEVSAVVSIESHNRGQVGV